MRGFTLADQNGFAELSGDFNPMHVDAQAARRLMFARPVVHGIHLVLWALDAWVAEQPGPVRLNAISAHFRNPVCVGDNVDWSEKPARGDADGTVTLILRLDGAQSAEIKFEPAPWEANSGETALPRELPGPICREPAEETFGQARGELTPALDRAALAARFPTLAARVPAWQIACLLASTRLVGMECPGLHSVYSRLNLRFGPDPEALQSLDWQATSYDPRFRFLRMALTGPGVEGGIEALVRTPPVEQPAIGELTGLVAPDAFAGQRALVVGGSRGVGETLAKLLAAGGADLRITWVAGEADAARVVEELTAAGLSAGSCRLDVLRPEDGVPEALVEWAPTDLFYLATPRIGVTKNRRFDTEMFSRLCGYYVDGFVRLVQGLPREHLRHIFYPSSIYVAERPAKFSEYVAAKAAGEAVCESLAGLNRDLSILCPRLPRMATDQTGDGAAVAQVLPAPMLALQDVPAGESRLWMPGT